MIMSNSCCFLLFIWPVILKKMIWMTSICNAAFLNFDFIFYFYIQYLFGSSTSWFVLVELEAWSNYASLSVCVVTCWSNLCRCLQYMHSNTVICLYIYISTQLSKSLWLQYMHTNYTVCLFIFILCVCVCVSTCTVVSVSNVCTVFTKTVFSLSGSFKYISYEWFDVRFYSVGLCVCFL